MSILPRKNVLQIKGCGKIIFDVHRQTFTSFFSTGTAKLESSDDLYYLADKYCQHLGRDTFFDLIPPDWEG